MTAIAAGLALVAVLTGRAAWVDARRHAARPLSGSVPRIAIRTPRSIVELCDAADVAVAPVVAWRWYRAALLIGPLVVLVATGPPIAVGVLVALVTAPHAALPGLRRRRSARRDDQLAPFLERLASTIRSGRTLRAALIDVAAVTDRPLGRDLLPLAHALRNGASLEDAVQRWAADPTAGAEVRLAAAALRLGAQAGGEVARAVDGVAATLRERREVRGELVALATQARTSAALLVVAPIGFAALMSTIEPGAVRFLLGTPVGLLCLATGLALDAAGGWWMQRIIGRAA